MVEKKQNGRCNKLGAASCRVTTREGKSPPPTSSRSVSTQLQRVLIIGVDCVFSRSWPEYFPKLAAMGNDIYSRKFRHKFEQP
jgi:hypothetical protein